jgi:hypothetical protein
MPGENKKNRSVSRMANRKTDRKPDKRKQMIRITALAIAGVMAVSVLLLTVVK